METSTGLTGKEQSAIKLGRFSGSGIYKLIPEGRRDMTADELAEEKAKGGKRKTIDTPFGDTAMSYIYEKVAERLTGCRKEFKPTAEIRRGIEMEPSAKLYLEIAKGIKVKNVGVQHDEYTAWSIDGWVDDFNTGIEILCPNSDNHLKYLLGNQIDIKENYPVKYWQMTFYAWKNNRPNWKFISFDDRFIKNEQRMLLLDFKVNKEDQEYMINKINLAIEIFNSLISKL